MAEPEERLGEGEGGKGVEREEDEEGGRVRLDNAEVKERRESEEGRIRGREEELRGRGGLDFTRGLISLKQMQEHSFSLVNQVKTSNESWQYASTKSQHFDLFCNKTFTAKRFQSSGIVGGQGY